MKKSTLMIPVICLLALASCGGNPSPSTSDVPSAGGSDSTPSVPVPVTDWTDADKTLMKAHLNNHVMPYMSIPGYTVTWNSTQSTIDIVTTTGGATGMDTSYKSALEADGFDVNYYELYGVYQADKTIENGVALYAQFTLSEKAFAIYAWIETPVTAWPAAGIVKFFSDHELTVNDTVPAFTAPYYFTADYYDKYECFDITMRDQTSVATTEDVYNKTLTDAGWTLDKTKYDDEGIYATAPNETIKLLYYFLDGTFSISVYHNIPKVLEWPAEAIATMLGADVTEVVPEFAWATGYQVTVTEESDTSYANVMIQINDVTGDDEAAMIAKTETVYNKTLTDGKWILDDSQYADYGYFVTSPLEQILIQHELVDGVYTIVIYKNHDLSDFTFDAAWPTEAVAAALPTGEGAAVVPAPAAGLAYSHKAIALDDGSTGIEVRVAYADMAAAKTAYETVLTTAGFAKPEGKDFYVDNVTTPTIKISLATEQLSESGYNYLEIFASNYVAPVVDGVFDLSKAAQLTSVSADKAVWTSGVVTMTIDKNGSDLDIGNTGQVNMPNTTDGASRIYATQKITIEVGEANAISTIVFTCNGKKAGAAAITDGTIVGGAAVADGNVITLTATDATIDTVTIVVSAQIQLTGVVVNFAAKA